VSGSWPAPTHTVDGLAVDVIGHGLPVLVLPYPHGSTFEPMAFGPLVRTLTGRRVVTFDPPGAYRSSRDPTFTVEEIRGCALESLRVAGVEGPVDVVGHSMGAFCALDLALAHPERVARLVLVGVPAGGWWPILRHRGLPFAWPPWDRRFWQYTIWGLRLARGGGTLALHKRHVDLSEQVDVFDPELRAPLDLRPGDEARPPPIRNRWIATVSGQNLLPRLRRIRAPALVCVGRHDRSTPLGANREVARRIPGARLEVFERSGHLPFLEEPERFAEVVDTFLDGRGRLR